MRRYRFHRSGSIDIAIFPSGDDLRLAKTNEQVEETLVGRLIVEEAKLSAFAHVGDHFDWTAKIGIGVPGRSDRSKSASTKLCLRAISAHSGPASAS